jgi:3-isopropylmalate/(R)-2-methylmalate dehydratase small subunit
MKPFVTVTGVAAPLLQANIDTDVIIRIERLTGRADLGHYALEAMRYLPDGSPNPNCVLNEPRFGNAPILLAGRNFGCGSSREGAVTALMAMGVRCVIAPSFGDIFHANCFRNGFLPVELPESAIEKLAEQSRRFRSTRCSETPCSKVSTKSVSRSNAPTRSTHGRTPIGWIVRGSGRPRR